VTFFPIWTGLEFKPGIWGEKTATNRLKAMSVRVCAWVRVYLPGVSTWGYSGLDGLR
jgi:hypothetical protein